MQYKSKQLFGKRRDNCITIVLLVFLLITGFLVFHSYQNVKTKASFSLSSETHDEYIYVSWQGANSYIGKYINVFCGDSLVTKIIINNSGYYFFKDGIHGNIYTFRTDFCNDSNQHYETESIFLKYSKMPNIPFVVITTEESMEPNVNIVSSDFNDSLYTIEKGEWINSTIEIKHNGTLSGVNRKGKIRARGNSSVMNYKTPYKIKFNEEIDLFNQGSKYKNKEYLLLGTAEKNLNYPISSYISSAINNQSYFPKYSYINLMINGNYKGTYLLTEIPNNLIKLNISDNGFLFENDAYFWNEKNYFQTNHQQFWMGYTFKYPKEKDIKTSEIRFLEDYINEFEKNLYSFNENYAEYIDVNSFAQWVLFNDIVGNEDMAGSNMFLYIEDITKNAKKRIKMGPHWDFDAILRSDNSRWSAIHYSDIMYFKELFFMESFRNDYKKEVEKNVTNNFINGINCFIDDFIDKNGTELEKSLILEKRLYKKQYPSLIEQARTAKDYFSIRCKWIMNNTDNLTDYDFDFNDDGDLKFKVFNISNEFDSLKIAVWDSDGDMKDLVWLKGNRNEKHYFFDINKCYLNTKIHIYGITVEGKEVFIDEIVFSR